MGDFGWGIFNINLGEDFEVQGTIPQNIFNAYTADLGGGANDMYRISDSIITDAVAEAVGSETNLYRKAMLLHDYVMDHMEYGFDGVWDPAPNVLTGGSGSCSEYVFLYVALCRAAQIPARYLASTVLGYSGGPPDTLPVLDDMYHRWVQIYLPGYGWFPVDVTWDDSTSSDMYFGSTVNRLVVSNINGGDSSLLGWEHHAVGVFSQDVEIQEGIGAEWTEWAPVSPKEIKEQAAAELERMETGIPDADYIIDQAVMDIQSSLDNAYWLDNFHLASDGQSVFYKASRAIWRLNMVTSQYGI